ncbi:MAG: polysaccharide deacetylase family protein [Verrucomicrobiota bacterium]
MLGCAAYQAGSGNFATAFGLAIASSAVSLAPTLIKNSFWWGPILTSIPTLHRELWLTIDDGPVPDQTPYTLDVLAKHNVRASFFVIGKQVGAEPSICRRMIAEGHTVENHTYSHPEYRFWFATKRQAEDEIVHGSRAISDAVGVFPSYFRAPVGFANLNVHRAAAQNNLTLVGWSASGVDGVSHTQENVIRKLIRSVQPGGIVLLHDSRVTNTPPGKRAQTLDRALTLLKDRNYTFCLPSPTAPTLA